ncbi:MAG: response regulator [Deltaproteobacteria bacterium]|nr:response regulator [Deltaproteobacteria bacterium]
MAASYRGSILVVEDEKPLRTNLQSLLKSLGYTVFGVERGEEGLTHLQARKIDLVVTDIRLPGMTGLGLVEQIHKNYPGTQVVVITGYGTLDTAIQAMRMGAQDYIQKPFDFDLLRLTIERVMERIELRCQIEEEQRKVLEYARDLEKTNEELKRTQTALLEKERAEAIHQLAGAAAHELNQPLMVILGAAEMLKKELTRNAKVRARVETIAQQADRMADLVRKIGKITRYETRSYAGGKEILDLEESSSPKNS